MLLDPENGGLAVEVLFLDVTEAEIHCYMYFMNVKNIYHRFGSRHFGISGGSGVAKNVPVCSPTIFRKSH